MPCLDLQGTYSLFRLERDRHDRGEVNTTKRTYEILYITDASYTDEQVQAVIDKYSAIIADTGGDLIAHGRWDKRRLAYEIKGRREGIYILTYFSAEASTPKELDRVFRISDDVFRHIILQIEDSAIDTSRLDRPFVEEAEPVAAAESEAVAEPEAAIEEAAEPEAEAAVETPTVDEAPAEAEPETAAEAAPEVEAEEQQEAPIEEPAAEETKE
jgi:small subunit ribosomal protein S6